MSYANSEFSNIFQTNMIKSERTMFKGKYKSNLYYVFKNNSDSTNAKNVLIEEKK